MSDIHQLPLLGHDLPEMVTRHPAKARVFKTDQYWTWAHRCGQSPQRTYGQSHMGQPAALHFALLHLERCR